MDKDWTGNSKSTYITIGASNHSEFDRAEHEFYATDPSAIVSLYEQTDFFEGVENVWECACGRGDLSEQMKALGLDVYSSDLYDHNYGEIAVDFLSASLPKGTDAIVTNPPYRDALPFVKRCVELEVPKFAMFLKLTFLEGQTRRKFFDKHPPRYVCVFSNRMTVLHSGEESNFNKSSAVCYAWFIWEKDYRGKPEVMWLWGDKR